MPGYTSHRRIMPLPDKLTHPPGTKSVQDVIYFHVIPKYKPQLIKGKITTKCSSRKKKTYALLSSHQLLCKTTIKMIKSLRWT